MDQKLNGENPLSYRGVNAYSPPEFVMNKRAPTTKDYKNFIIGTIWLDTSVTPPSATSIYILTSVARGIATWVQFAVGVSSLETLTGDAGGAVGPDINKNINVVSNNVGLEFTGDPATNTLALDVTGGYTLLRSLTDDAVTDVYPNVLGQIQLEGTGGITTTSNVGAHKIVIDGTGAGGISTFTEDTGSAAPVAGNINILGGTLINTSGAGSTVTVNSSAVGALQSDAGTANVAANTIKIVGAGTVSTSASGDTVTITGSGGAGSVSQFTADDSGVATPALGNINVFGTAGHITTSATGDTITIDTGSDIATSYVCDTGTAIPAASILMMLGGSYINTVGSTDTVTINASSIPVSNTTYFTSSGTWTKKPSTQYVTIYLWCGGGGGGGGSNNASSPGQSNGGGGGSGGAVYVMLNEPAATFGASETIVVGAGGGGGASIVDGNPGGVSSVGSIIVPPAQTNYGRSANNNGYGGGDVPIVTVGGSTIYAAGGAVGGRYNFSPAHPAGFDSDYHVVSSGVNLSLAGTGGGGGGSIERGGGGAIGGGGASGSQRLSGGTVIVAGAPASGYSSNVQNYGVNGNDGYVYNNVMVAGTGGSGSGPNVTAASNANYGGNGGFPAAGGGGGSGCTAVQGIGGNGGNGLVIIIES